MFINKVANRITFVGNFDLCFSSFSFDVSFDFSIFFFVLSCVEDPREDQHRSISRIFPDKIKSDDLLDTSHVLRSRSFNSATLPVRCTSFLSLDAITQVHNGREETGRKCYISRSCARTSFPPGFSLTWHRIGVKRATSALARGSRKTGGCPVRYRRFYTRLD